MKNKSTKIVKPSSAPTSAIDTMPTAQCKLLFPSSPEPLDVILELTPNPNKVDIMQPGLLGCCHFGELEVSLAVWGSQTRDQSRYYYSCAMHDALKKKEAWK